MGLFNRGKKAAKFTFVSMPLSILGVKQLSMGNQHIKDLWKSTVNPVCPACDKGVLVQQASEEHVLDHSLKGPARELHPWVCSNCHFGFLEENDVKKARASANRYRNERVKLALTDLELEEREQIARAHRLHSRAFYAAALIAISGFLYLLASGAALLVACNWLSIAFALWVFGMKKSYRSWQVTTGQLFMQGAFRYWFQHERWII